MAKKQKRDNDYYLDVLERHHPTVFLDWKAGRFSSPRQAFIAAGLKKERSLLNMLKSAWSKASAAERRDFLTAIAAGSGSTASTSSSPPATLTDRDGRLLASVEARVKQIIDKRNIRMGDVMTEMGFAALDPSLGQAMSRARRARVRPDLQKALERWLHDNKGV
jgi:hypothetical protein